MKKEIKSKLIESAIYFALFPFLGIMGFEKSTGGHDFLPIFLVFFIPFVMAYFFVFRTDSIKEFFTKAGIYLVILLIGYFTYVKNDFGEYSLLFFLALILSAIAYGIKKLIQKFKGNK